MTGIIDHGDLDGLGFIVRGRGRHGGDGLCSDVRGICGNGDGACLGGLEYKAGGLVQIKIDQRGCLHGSARLRSDRYGLRRLSHGCHGRHVLFRDHDVERAHGGLARGDLIQAIFGKRLGNALARCGYRHEGSRSVRGDGGVAGGDCVGCDGRIGGCSRGGRRGGMAGRGGPADHTGSAGAGEFLERDLVNVLGLQGIAANGRVVREHGVDFLPRLGLGHGVGGARDHRNVVGLAVAAKEALDIRLK